MIFSYNYFSISSIYLGDPKRNSDLKMAAKRQEVYLEAQKVSASKKLTPIEELAKVR